MTKLEKLTELAEKYGTWPDSPEHSTIIAKIRRVAANRGVDPEPEIVAIMGAEGD